MSRTSIVAALCLAACVSLPKDRAVVGRAEAPLVSTAVRCDCVVNEHRDDKQCTDPKRCPGPDCDCPGMDFDLCLPPDLNGDTATDPAVRARLGSPDFDFNAAVQAFCRERASEIMIDVGAVSQHGIICRGDSNSYFTVDVPALVHCQAVAYDGRAGSPSTWRSAACATPCGDVPCINGPRSERPNANCDGDDVFTRTALHPEACRCNVVSAVSSCSGRPSERFCGPPPDEPRPPPPHSDGGR